jgi:xanthine permease XanP
VTTTEESPATFKEELVYGLNDRPPFTEGLFVAIQHTFAIFVPIVAPGLIICGALKINPTDTAYISGMALLISAIATFLQARTLTLPGFGSVPPTGIGTGLLTIQGTSFSYLGPLIAAGEAVVATGKPPEAALPLLLGLCFFGSFIMIFLSRFLDYTQKIFTPLVTGIVVSCIGLTLIKVGITDMAGGIPVMGTPTFGSPVNVGLSLLVLAIVTVCSVSRNRFLRMGSIVIGLIVGYLLSLFLGLIDFSDLKNLPLINVPVPMKYGLAFDPVAFIPVAIVYVASMLESIGDITATCMVTGEEISGGTYFRRVKAGVLANGLTCLLSSSFSTFPVTTMSQNNGLIKLTGVGSRYIGYYLAVILAILGIFPIIGGFLQKIPSPVLGGATILMFGSIAVAGFNILRTVEMDARASVITAVSLSAALGVTFVPEFLDQLHPLIKQVFASGISTGAIFALILNLILPGRTPVADLATEAAEIAREELIP